MGISDAIFRFPGAPVYMSTIFLSNLIKFKILSTETIISKFY